MYYKKFNNRDNTAHTAPGLRNRTACEIAARKTSIAFMARDAVRFPHLPPLWPHLTHHGRSEP